MECKSLNDLYNEFKNNILTRSELESLVFNFYLNNQEKTCICYWKREDYEDFISWFYPRLKKAIDKYNDKGNTFELFLSKFFSIASKEYKVNKISGNLTEYSAWSARIEDLFVHEEPPEYPAYTNENLLSDIIQDKKGRKDSRRLLALIIKCYHYISDDFIEKAAPLLEMRKKDLKIMIEKIRVIRHEKDDEIYKIKEKIHCQFYKCIVIEKKLMLIKENTTTYNKLVKQHKNARIKLEKMREKFTLLKKDATNSEVAEVIGVCKGSVDSSLYKLKEKYNLN